MSSRLLILGITINCLLCFVNGSACTDFYVYKSKLDSHSSYQDSSSDFTRGSKSNTLEENPKKEGLRPVDLNSEEDVDWQFYDSGTEGLTNYDYIVPLCFNNQTFLLKTDLLSSLISIAALDLKEFSLRKYQPSLSLNHEILYEHNSRCLHSVNSVKQENFGGQSRYSSQTTKCMFLNHDDIQNYTTYGENMLEQVDLQFNSNGSPIGPVSNIGKSLKVEEKIIMGFANTIYKLHYFMGLLRYQNYPMIIKNINGFLGMGSSGLDNSYSESFLNRMTEIYNLNGKVFSMCLNHQFESGGVMMIGGYDQQHISSEAFLGWITFSKVNRYLGLNVLFETKTPFIHLTDSMLEAFIQAFIKESCKNIRGIENLKPLCQDDESNIFRKDSTSSQEIKNYSILPIVEEAFVIVKNEKEFINSLKPLLINFLKVFPLELNFNRNGVYLKISNYLVKCQNINPKAASNTYCSILKSYNPTTLTDIVNKDTPTIVLGSFVLRNYLVIIDNQLSRIGLAKKKNGQCTIDKVDDIIPLNDNNHIRLSFVNIYSLFYYDQGQTAAFSQ